MFRDILISSSIFCAVTSFCLNDWVRHDNSCYYFAHLPSDRVTWHEAAIECLWRNNSHLVIVETMGEHEFIKRHLAELQPESDEYFWTYGNDIHAENIWYWGETPKNTITTTFWHPGQPDNYYGLEDCLCYATRFQFDWNDLICGEAQYYICEIPDDIGAVTVG